MTWLEPVWREPVWRDMAQNERAWQARMSKAWSIKVRRDLGVVRHGMAGEAWRELGPVECDQVWCGKGLAGDGRFGLVATDVAGQARAGLNGRGLVRRDVVGSSMAGVAGHGQDRHGMDCRGSTGPA